MQGNGRKTRNSVYQSFDVYEAPRAGMAQRVLPVAFGGLILLMAVVFGGNMIGRNADASNNHQAMAPLAALAPTSALEGKGSLLAEATGALDLQVPALRRQTVFSEGKTDLAETAAPVILAPPPPLPKAKPANMAKLVAAQKAIKIIPASYQPSEDEAAAPVPAVKRLLSTPAAPVGPLVLVPPSAKPLPAPKAAPQQDVATTVDHAPSLPKSNAPTALERIKTAELTCLARAVYFESRSESDLGQLAVAKVVLNRVKHPDFPKTICGVVYQGSDRRNSCQFSFACDGMADAVASPAAWSHAKQIAERAIADDPAIRMLHAVNYHADYVNPRWSKTMRRIIRIGHHIFYGNRAG